MGLGVVSLPLIIYYFVVSFIAGSIWGGALAKFLSDKILQTGVLSKGGWAWFFYTAWYFSVIYILGMFLIYLKFPKDSWKRFFGGSKSEYTKDSNKILEAVKFLIMIKRNIFI